MNNQLALFPHEACDDELIPITNPEAQLDMGAALARADWYIFSVSGGKDSDAMTRFWLPRLREKNPNAHFVAVHADLGRAEWSVTSSYVEKFCREMCLELHVVKHTKYDLIEGIRQRMMKRPDAPPFPSAAARYCTSDYKRSVISRWIRQNTTGKVVCMMGFRAEESPARAKRPRITEREDCWSVQKHRYVYDVLPIHGWTLEEVWETIGYKMRFVKEFQADMKNWAKYGPVARTQADYINEWWKAHPAYAYGNERLSCALCILGSVNDLMNGAIHEPDTYRALCQIEIESGFSFRKNLWLGTLTPSLLTDEMRAWYAQKGILE